MDLSDFTIPKNKQTKIIIIIMKNKKKIINKNNTIRIKIKSVS